MRCENIATIGKKMSGKSILFAHGDPAAINEFRHTFGEPWEVVPAGTGPAALAELVKRSFDVLVTDLDLPEMDGAALLTQTRKDHPRTLCFILASEADRERVMKNVLGAHQFLAKPCDYSVLKRNMERALALDTWIASTSMRDLVSRVRTFPTVPSLYLEILSALKSPNATTEQIGRIIAKDMSMMTKLLQVINSACFGLPRKISDPVEAVGLIGFEAVKSMVMTIKLLSQYDKIKPVYFSIDKLWRHSTEVARSARNLTLFHTDNATMAETAFTAGLVHDMGKVVLAANFDEQYRGAQSLARKQKLPLEEVEKEIFGASHGEIGAYLLGLWGMPLDLMEVAALHHHPARGTVKEFNPLTAVHVANALEYELNPDKEETVVSKIDEAYLSDIGVLEELNIWREAILKRDFTKSASKPRAVKPAPTMLKLAVAPAVSNKPSDSTSQGRSIKPAGKPWAFDVAWLLQKRALMFVALLVGVAGSLVFWLSSRPSAGDAAPVETAQVTESPTNSTNSFPQITNVVEQTPAVPVSNSVAVPALTPTMVVRARTADTPTVATNPVKTSSADPAFADLKLQGILYSKNYPSAIISGKTVHPNDRISGGRVVEITEDGVTLEYQNHLKKLVLK